jgi:serine O-acetyltransferase
MAIGTRIGEPVEPTVTMLIIPSLPRNYRELVLLLRADFFRYDGASGFGPCLRTYFTEPGAKFTFWLRVSSCLRSKKILLPLFLFAWWMRHRCEIRYGLSVPCRTCIGPGLYFSHFGGIVVNADARIGRNCNVGHGVTIGQANRGKRQGVPTIGDNVFIGPGAKIFGNVTVGSGAAIGANAVVTTDVPAGAVVAGAPAKVVSMGGSAGYIDHTGYSWPE